MLRRDNPFCVHSCPFCWRASNLFSYSWCTRIALKSERSYLSPQSSLLLVVVRVRSGELDLLQRLSSRQQSVRSWAASLQELWGFTIWNFRLNLSWNSKILIFLQKLAKKRRYVPHGCSILKFHALMWVQRKNNFFHIFDLIYTRNPALRVWYATFSVYFTILGP